LKCKNNLEVLEAMFPFFDKMSAHVQIANALPQHVLEFFFSQSNSMRPRKFLAILRLFIKKGFRFNVVTSVYLKNSRIPIIVDHKEELFPYFSF
jgi:hypothetical protein